MKAKTLASIILGSTCAATSCSLAQQPLLRINEIVVDPQYDWNEDGIVSPSDEWFEIYNPNPFQISLYGMMMHFIDTTPMARSLSDYEFLAPFGYLVIRDPEGMQNNNGRVEIRDLLGNIIDGFSYGNWEGNTVNIPSGNATGLHNESLSRFTDGADFFYTTWATPAASNVPTPGTLGLLGLIGLHAARRKRKWY